MPYAIGFQLNNVTSPHGSIVGQPSHPPPQLIIFNNTQRRNIVCGFRSRWQNHKTRCHYKIAQRYCCHIPQTMHTCLLHRKPRVVPCRWINNHFHFRVKNLSNPSLNCQFTFHIVCHTYMGLTHCKA